MTTRTIPLQKIRIPDDLHRLSIDDAELKDLATSIQTLGLINPITVSENIDDTFLLIAGHRRYLAHELLGRSTIEATIHSGSARDADAKRFAENMQRAQLSPMEEAYALHHQHHDNLVPLDALAHMLNRSLEWVELRVGLVEIYPDLRELIHTGQLAIGSAIALATVTDEAHRNYLTAYALNAGASVTVIREWVRSWQNAQDMGRPSDAPLPAMPMPGQQVVVTMPCAACGDPHPYTELRVLRICGPCGTVVANSAASSTHVAP